MKVANVLCLIQYTETSYTNKRYMYMYIMQNL